MARTGRPRGFDRNDAVTSAMHLFWQHGYEATSLDQLKRCMGGISAASFYAAFGSKQTLYDEALRQYLKTHGEVMASLSDETLSPREAIELAFRRSVRMQTDPSHPSGCMVVLSVAAGSQNSLALRSPTAATRQTNRDMILSCVRRGIARGELGKETDAGGLAALFEGLLVGFSIQARDGVPAASLDAAITSALGMWGDSGAGNPAATPRE